AARLAPFLVGGVASFAVVSFAMTAPRQLPKEKGGRFPRRPSRYVSYDDYGLGLAIAGRASARTTHFIGNLIKGIAQRFTQRGHRGDRGDRDQGGDQAVFDGGGALLVTEQLVEELHGRLL